MAMQCRSLRYNLALVCLGVLYAARALAGPPQIACTSDPPGASVLIRPGGTPEERDRDMGETPLDFIITAVTARERPFAITVSLEGYHPWHATVSLRTGIWVDVHAELTALGQPAPDTPGPDAVRVVSDRGPWGEAEDVDDRVEGPSFPERAEPLPPGEAEVVFFRDDGLFVATADGDDAFRLATVGRDAPRTAPAWSPDKTRVAYVDGGDLWVVPIDGGKPDRLVEASSLRASSGFWHNYRPRCDGPRWSPDGELIVFRHLTRDGFFNLYAVTAAGSHARLLVEIVEESLDWHPSLPRLAVESPGSVLVVDAGGDGHGELLAVLPNARDPAWSPEGDQLAVVADGELWLTDASGSHARRAFAQSGYPLRHPLWLPDGEQVVAIANARRPLGPRWDEIWLIDLAHAGAPKLLASMADEVGSRRSVGFLSTATDGTGLVYALGYRPTSFVALDLETLTGTTLIEAVRKPQWAGTPKRKWSPLWDLLRPDR